MSTIIDEAKEWPAARRLRSDIPIRRGIDRLIIATVQCPVCQAKSHQERHDSEHRTCPPDDELFARIFGAWCTEVMKLPGGTSIGQCPSCRQFIRLQPGSRVHEYESR